MKRWWWTRSGASLQFAGTEGGVCTSTWTGRTFGSTAAERGCAWTNGMEATQRACLRKSCWWRTIVTFTSPGRSLLGIGLEIQRRPMKLTRMRTGTFAFRIRGPHDLTWRPGFLRSDRLRCGSGWRNRMRSPSSRRRLLERLDEGIELVTGSARRRSARSRRLRSGRGASLGLRL